MDGMTTPQQAAEAAAAKICEVSHQKTRGRFGKAEITQVILESFAPVLAQLEATEFMLFDVIDANYGGSPHHIGDGDGITEKDAIQIKEWISANHDRVLEAMRVAAMKASQ